MVELKLESLDAAISKDTYISIRVGDIQKLSRGGQQSRVYKFPQGAIGERKYGKLEVFKRVGCCSIGIVPDQITDQEVSVAMENMNSAKFKVSLNGIGDKVVASPVQTTKSAKVGEPNPKITAAKEYLENHNLEMRLSEAMQAVLREKPDDPAAYIAAQLAKSAGQVTRKPRPPVARAPAPAHVNPAPTGAAKEPAQAAALSQVLPFSQYFKSHMRQCPQKEFQDLYAMFPRKDAAARPPDKVDIKPADKVDVASSQAEAESSRVDVTGSSIPDCPYDRAADASAPFAHRPSIGTWAQPLRSAKLPRGAAGRRA